MSLFKYSPNICRYIIYQHTILLSTFTYIKLKYDIFCMRFYDLNSDANYTHMTSQIINMLQRLFSLSHQVYMIQVFVLPLRSKLLPVKQQFKLHSYKISARIYGKPLKTIITKQYTHAMSNMSNLLCI